MDIQLINNMIRYYQARLDDEVRGNPSSEAANYLSSTLRDLRSKAQQALEAGKSACADMGGMEHCMGQAQQS